MPGRNALVRRTVFAAALAVGALTGPTAPAGAAPGNPAPANPAPATRAPAAVAGAAAGVQRLCGSWDQVIPSVWAIVCLDRSGALFQPYGEMRNHSAHPVTMDQFIYLNSGLHTQCGTWPSTAAPGATMGCTNNTWKVAAAPRWAAGVFWVNGVQKTLYSPSFP